LRKGFRGKGGGETEKWGGFFRKETQKKGKGEKSGGRNLGKQRGTAKGRTKKNAIIFGKAKGEKKRWGGAAGKKFTRDLGKKGKKRPRRELVRKGSGGGKGIVVKPEKGKPNKRGSSKLQRIVKERPKKEKKNDTLLNVRGEGKRPGGEEKRKKAIASE